MKKGLKFIKTNALSFIVGAFVFGGIGFALAESLASGDMAYSNENHPNVTNVEEALDDLYSKVRVENNDGTFAQYCNSIYANCTIAKKMVADSSNNIFYHDGINNGNVLNYNNKANEACYTNENSETICELSYRYSGANPDNYVCFGYDTNNITDTNNNSIPDECESGTFSASSEFAYRIIGVFNKNFRDLSLPQEYELKLIKSVSASTDQLGTSSYKSDKFWYWGMNKGGSNTAQLSWENNTFITDSLNGYYLNTYLGGNNEAWYRLISDHDWIVGGYNHSTNYGVRGANNIYKAELISPVNDITYNAKIGLMYMVDYEYAADPDIWEQPLEYNSKTGYGINTNWLQKNVGTDGEFTITYVLSYEYPNYVYGIGHYYGNISQTDPYKSIVRPAFYLNSNVTFASGDGTITSPYILSIN